MTPLARSLALRAAAKVAFAGSLVACGNATPSPTTKAPTPKSDPTLAVTPNDAPKPIASTQCAPKDRKNPTPSEVACCTDVVHAGAANGGALQSDAQIACCDALVHWNDAQMMAGHAGQDGVPERSACCEALKWQGSATCTPWGPPVPPSLNDASLPPRAEQGRGMGAAPLDLREAARAHRPQLPPLPHLFASARATWLGRMANEHASSSVFEALAAQLAEAEVDVELVRACASFADDERRHGVLCGAVVEALGGEARADLHEKSAFPRHDDVSRFEAALRNVLDVCCLSETVAVALIGAERAEMDKGELRDLLTSIWSDEIGHARFGWELLAAHAPMLDDGARARLSIYLRVAFAHLERHELAHLPIDAAPPLEGRALGLCDGADARALFYDTVEQVVVPRLTSLGFDAEGAWRDRGAIV